MKRIIASIAAALTLMFSLAVGSAHAQASYCGTSSWEIQYRAQYEYPTGSYWVGQINAYPEYYQANNAYYQDNYGC